MRYRCLDGRVSEHQLNDADVDGIGQRPAGALVPQIVPVQINLPQLVTIDPSSRSHALRVVPVRDQEDDSQAVLKLSWKSPSGEPNTNASNPSCPRRLRIRASRGP